MIAFVRGILVGKTLQSACVDVNGLGLEVFMAQSSLAKLPETGNEVTIQTYYQVREDGVSLYGFSSSEEKALFEKLISISGVGPKVALASLSFYAPAQLAEAVMEQDVARISKIPGVGKKTASRIILELKGSFEKEELSLSSATGASGTSCEDSVVAGIVQALLSMGFTEQEATLAIKGAPTGASEGALLQYALKRLGSNE
jgi:holliday junction DNA helicase RuvA